MATATPKHGSKADFKIAGASISDHIQGTIGMEQDYPVVDTTVFGATSTTHITSPIQDNKAQTYTLLYDQTTHNTLVALAGVDGTAWVYSPEGTGVGTPKCSGVGSLSNYQVKSDLNNVTMITFTFTPSGPGTWATN